MHGLISLLPQPYYAQVEALWDELESKFGLRGIRITPYPHFSWQIGEDYPEEALVSAMHTLAYETEPLKVHAKGIETFTSQRPVAFIKVIKDPALVRLHERIWMDFLPITKGASTLYSPPLWHPHISLAYDDLTSENIETVVTWLKTKPIDWTFVVDNIAFIYEPAGEVGQVKHRFAFQG